MKFFYLRTLLILVCGWLVAYDTAYAQPNGNYGTKGTRYSVPSGAYFVSPNGKGGTPCSQGNPCSLSKALSSAPSGTTIVLRGGTYRTSSYNTRIPRKLTLQPYPGEQVILKGSELANDWKSEGGDWKTSWKKLYPAKYVRDKYNIVTKENPMAAHQDMVFVNGKALKQVGSRGEVKPGTFYVDYSRKLVYIGSRPGRNNVEITASEWGLHTYGVNVSGITVRGLKLMHYAECGIMLQSPDAVIENNVFTENAIAGMKIYNAKRATIRHNHFSKNGLQGAGINNSDQLRFEHNLVEKNNAEKHNRTSWSAAGIKVLESKDCMIRNNLFRDNDANGIWLDNYASKSFIINNRIENETRNGIHCEISNDAVIAGNVVTGCGYNPQGHGSGIEVVNSAKVRVYNNTIVKNYINLTVADASRPKGLPQNETGARNVIVKNNLLSDATVNEYPSSQLWAKRRNCSQDVIKELDHNGYHRTNSRNPDLLVRWKVQGGCSEEEKIATLDQLQRKLRLGHNSIALTGNDPFFENRSSGNYKLKKGSPAIKAGSSVPSDIRQALGWKSGGSVDMGAYQSGYSAAPAPSSPTPTAKTGNLPWVESFSSSKFKGVVDKQKLYRNGTIKAEDGKLVARGVGQVTWKSDVIKLEGKTVKFSMQLSSIGSLESNDGVQVYYKINNGAEKLAGEVKDNLSSTKTIALSGVKGNTLQLVVRIRNSDITERYLLHEVKVEATGSNARIADAKKPAASQAAEEAAALVMPSHEVEVYPNPVATTLQVHLNTEAAGQVSLVLLDMNGSTLQQQQAQGQEAVSMDVSALQTGVYLLQIIDEQGSRQTHRIIKQ